MAGSVHVHHGRVQSDHEEPDQRREQGRPSIAGPARARQAIRAGGRAGECRCWRRGSWTSQPTTPTSPAYDGALVVAVALLRTEAGRNPRDKDLSDLVGELATRSEAFRIRWGAHDGRLHRGGIKTFNHPVVGYMELAYDSMDLVAAPGLVLTAYTAEPATASADNLSLLASWAGTQAEGALATPEQAGTGPSQADTSNSG
jgi:hypothetical protein